MTTHILLVGWCLDQFFLEAGSVRVRIAVDQPHDVGAISGELGTHHEADRLARLHAEAITITDDLHSTDCVAVDGRPQRHDEQRDEGTIHVPLPSPS